MLAVFFRVFDVMNPIADRQDYRQKLDHRRCIFLSSPLRLSQEQGHANDSKLGCQMRVP